MNSVFLVAAILYAVGFVPYMVAILRPEHRPANFPSRLWSVVIWLAPTQGRPQKSSWIIYSSLDMVALASGIFLAHKGEANPVNFQLITAAIGATTVMFISFRRGVPGWTTLDKVVIAGAVVGAVVWYFRPDWSLYISLLLMTVGSYPTWKWAWSNSQDESKLGWTLFFLSCVVALFGVEDWHDINVWLQPVVFLFIESVMMVIFYIVPVFRRTKEAA
ncbi:MAG: hypothetical protein ABIH41_05480 [Nanoarchaeota archaeon]